MHRGAVAEIDLDAVIHNLGIVRKITSDRRVIAVVKADAYGHGSVEVSRRLEKAGVSYLAVALSSEAVKLREAGVRSPIIVLFDRQDIPSFFEYDLIPVISDLGFARRLSEEAGRRRRSLQVHIKVDTGMGRLGFGPENLSKAVTAISRTGSLVLSGLMSHFSDSDISDKSFAGIQVRTFLEAREIILKGRKGSEPLLCHMANSAATLSLRSAHFDAVRPGIMLYGCSPLTHPLKWKGGSPGILKPAMKITTEILTVKKFRKGSPVSYGRTFVTRRDSLIALLPVGYADGFSRAFSNNADVLIRGKRAPVVGRVCMDLTMVDVSGISPVREGDEVVLMGRQGDEEITAQEMAARAATIPYEILTSLGTRSRRIYTATARKRIVKRP